MTEEFSPQPDAIAETRESLIHIADLHFWKVVYNPLRLLNKRLIGNANVWLNRRHEFLMDKSEPYAEHVASLRIPQVLMTGDFSSTALDEEFMRGAVLVESLERKGLTPVLMPGNHDVYTFESLRAERFRKHFGRWLPTEESPYQKKLRGGTPLVLVPTVCPNMISSRGRITPGDVKAVEDLLSETASPLIVSGHYPLLDETYGYHLRLMRRLRNAHSLRRVLGESGCRILYVSGHVHRFSFVRDTDYPNLSHLTTGAFFALNETAGTDGEFSEIHVAGEEFRVRRHVHRDNWQSSDENEREASAPG